MSPSENCANHKPSASGLSERISSLGYLAYVVCYLIGARIIRYFRRFRRTVKRTALHTKWAVRRFYFDIKDQRTVPSVSKGRWKREWSSAFAQTRNALQDWNTHRQQPDAGLSLTEFFDAFRPAVKMCSRVVNYLLPVAGILVLTSTVHYFSTLTYGLHVEYNGEHIGYILTESDFSDAEAKVRERIVNEQYLPPEDSVPIYSLEIIEDDQISDQRTLVNNIIRASGNEIKEASGLYIDDQFIGAVEDDDALLMSLKARRDGTYIPGQSSEEPDETVEEEVLQETPEEVPEEAVEPAEEPAASEPDADAPAEPETPVEEVSTQQTHTIAEGDSLWSIANEYDVSTQELIDLNPEISQTMLIGQTLVISNGTASNQTEPVAEAPAETETPAQTEPDAGVPADETSASVEQASSQQTYTIQEGDSLWSIANEFGVSTQTLVSLNPEVSKTMLIGQTLVISGSASSPSSSTPVDNDEDSEDQPNSAPALPEDVIIQDETVSFVQSIRLEKGLYSVSSIESLDNINAKLDSVVEAEQTYTIQEGDSPWSIANKFDLPTQTLLNLNPEVSKTMLVGQTLVISQQQPFLQTKITRTITEENEIAFTTETEIDQNKEKSYQEVVQEGKKGREQIISEVTYINGYETERHVLSETVLEEPVNAKVVVGSLTSSVYNFSNSGSVSGGTNVGGYIWPVNGGYISCPIWGYSGHTGTDIAAPAGTTIWASKGGTVIHSGWSNGYGYNVLIDHGDGTKTRYAHCSSLAAYVGQQVSQGQVIGYVGRTGWASGNHCHFEIISSGSFLDARNYIGYSR